MCCPVSPPRLPSLTIIQPTPPLPSDLFPNVSGAFCIVLVTAEAPPAVDIAADLAEGETADSTTRGRAARVPATSTVVTVARKMWHTLQQPAVRPLLLLLATYKVGEMMADSMFKPFLVDSGLTQGEVARITSQGGMLFSILGSLFGGTLSIETAVRYQCYHFIRLHQKNVA